jgi:hypothetical protein
VPGRLLLSATVSSWHSASDLSYMLWKLEEHSARSQSQTFAAGARSEEHNCDRSWSQLHQAGLCRLVSGQISDSLLPHLPSVQTQPGPAYSAELRTMHVSVGCYDFRLCLWLAWPMRVAEEHLSKNLLIPITSPSQEQQTFQCKHFPHSICLGALTLVFLNPTSGQ